MANIDLVRSLMHIRLLNDSPVAVIQFGDQWEAQVMSSFYFLENQVDDAAISVMKEAIHFPQTNLTAKRWKELTDTVGLGTTVTNAIQKITDLSQFASEVKAKV